MSLCGATFLNYSLKHSSLLLYYRVPRTCIENISCSGVLKKLKNAVRWYPSDELLYQEYRVNDSWRVFREDVVSCLLDKPYEGWRMNFCRIQIDIISCIITSEYHWLLSYLYRYHLGLMTVSLTPFPSRSSVVFFVVCLVSMHASPPSPVDSKFPSAWCPLWVFPYHRSHN